MSTIHLSVLGLDAQWAVTPLGVAIAGADRVRPVRNEADLGQGRDLDDYVPGVSRMNVHAARAATERLMGRNAVDETRLPFTASLEEPYAAATDLLRRAAVDGDVQVSLAGAPPQAVAVLYATRAALVDGSELDRETVSLLTIPATDRPDLAVTDDLRSLVGDIEATSDALDGFRCVSDGPVVVVAARLFHTALSDLRDAFAGASGESRSNSRVGHIAGACGARSGSDSPLGATSSYVGHARGQLVDFVGSEDSCPDPEGTRDPGVVLDVLDAWLDGESRLPVSVGDGPHELVARFRTSYEARLGKFENRVIVGLFESLDRLETHLDTYLDTRSQLLAVISPVAERTTEPSERTVEIVTSLSVLDDSGPTVGESALEFDGHVLSSLGDLEAAVSSIPAVGPPRSRPWIRHGVAAEPRERVEHHGIVTDTCDDET